MPEYSAVRLSNCFNRSVAIRVGLTTNISGKRICWVGFNRSVAIRVGLTPHQETEGEATVWFQSLGRDSGRSDDAFPRRRLPQREFQSLGRDSGRSDGYQTVVGHVNCQFQSLGQRFGSV